jgi:hypothetical protein
VANEEASMSGRRYTDEYKAEAVKQVLVEVTPGNYEFTWTSPAAAACVRLKMELGDGNHTDTALFKFE